jgi:hypothetical protein
MAFQQLEDSIRNILKRLGVLENTPPATVADASSTVRGIVELATSAEAVAGTDSTRAITATGLAASRLRPTQGVIPSSVVVGSGSATVDSQGLITFTSSSSVSLNGVFDGLGGDVYSIQFDADLSANATIYLRMRSAGTDIASSWFWQWLRARGSALAANSYQNDAGFGITLTSNAASVVKSQIGITDAATSRKTMTTSQSTTVNIVNGEMSAYQTGGHHNSTDSFDGVTILVGAGNLTGKMKVVKIS